MTPRQAPPALAQAAVRYGQAGWPVFPLHEIRELACSCAAGADCRQPGKHLRTLNGFHDATVNPGRVGVWWTRWPTANIGVPTGRASGLVVVDLDGDAGRASWERLLAEHGPVPETATAVTPHGTHLWYRLPSGLSVPRRIGVRERLDILGDRGYAIVPPSAIPCAKPAEQHRPGHCTGNYTWTDRRSMAMVPEWVTALTHERDPDERRGTVTPQPVRDGDRKTYGQAAIDGEAARVANAAPGTRNDALNTAAWRLGRLVVGGELDPQHAAHALWEAARACGLVDDDGAQQVMRTIGSGLRAGMNQPRARRERTANTGPRGPGQPSLGIGL